MINGGQISDAVIVIGAGASGLAVAYELRERGLPVRIIDKAFRAGEVWHHRHPQLRLNTHRYLSGLPGMVIPKTAGAFPSRDDIIQYLDNYAEQLDVPIEYGVNVKHINRKKGVWLIETNKGVYSTRHVVVATGHDRVPLIPSWPGRKSFKNKFIHASDFGQLSSYRGKKVLVIGAGNSGTDILNHLSNIETQKIWVSVRHGPVIFPTHLYGVPVQLLSPILAKLPTPVVDGMLRLTEFLAFGNLKKWGLRKHRDGGATRLLISGTAPAIDNGFIAALKAGKVEVVAEVRAFEVDSVQLVNEQYIEPDIVIAATGYRTGLESIFMFGGVLNESGVPPVQGKQQLKDYPGLFFTGMQPGLPGFFYAAGLTGREIAKAIESEYKMKAVVTAKTEMKTATDNTAA